MGIDLGPGLGAGGAVDALQQILARRELQRQALAREAFQQQQLAEQQATRRQQLADQEYWHGQANDQREASNVAHMIDTMPKGADVDPTGAALMQKHGYGGMLQTKPTGVPLQGLPGVSQPTDNAAAAPDAIANPNPGMLFTGTRKEETSSNNAEERMRIAQLQADIRQQIANARTDAEKQHWQQMAELANARLGLAQDSLKFKQDQADAKANGTAEPKLGQRDSDTVTTIHQMGPMINDLLTNAKQRIQSKGGPSGTLGQLGERAVRGGQQALYNLGIGSEDPETGARIQLAELLKVLGTSPYLRGIRNMEYVHQVQQHLANGSLTDEALVDRLSQLQKYLPEMEQAVYDVHNKGVIPHSHENMPGMQPTRGATGAPVGAGKSNDPLGIR